jgi:non-ribosomal peptide synthetase component F
VSNEDLQKIWQWNAIVPSDVDDTVHNLISKQIGEHPNLQAVCAWDGDFKYSELDLLSSRLAEHLVQLGVGAETTVPLCFEKSKWTVVAILAVMRAGAAFTLLDPGAQPEARMKAIANQVRCKLVLTSVENQSLGTRLAERVVVVSEDSLKNITCVTENQHAWNQAIPSSALYIVFTSGSTGHPKGIVITHSNYLSGAMQRGALLGYGTNTRAFDFASYTFDASIERNLVSLIFGGCVCIPSDSARLDDIAGSISSLRANSLGLTPSVARLLKNKNIEGIKLLNLGGELAAATDISYWATRTRVVNRYGPAEASIVRWVLNTNFSLRSSILFMYSVYFQPLLIYQ